MRKVLYSLIFLSLFSFISSAQDAENLHKIYPTVEYQNDLDSLVHNLLTIHPSPFEFTSEETFWKTVEEKKDQINELTTYGEFIWMCSEIVANLNCGHTSLGWFNQEAKALPTELLFPIECRFIDGRLYVSDPLLNGDRVTPGTEVFAINGIDAHTIQERIYRHINSQGHNETYKRLLLNGYFPSYVPYALGFPASYEITAYGAKTPIQLSPLDEYQPKPRIDPENECQGNLCLEFLEESNTAVLTIRSFAYYGDKFPVYQSFIDDAFGQIRDQKADHLILDVRMNDGGPFYAARHLLQYLFDQPFAYWSYTAFEDEPIETYTPFDNRFSGEVFVLMDGNCSSSTPHFLSLVKQNKLGLLIGEEANGNHLTFGGQKWMALPHTGIRYCVGRNRYVSAATRFPKEQGIRPDHHVVQTIDDFLRKTDRVLAYTKALIMN